MLTVLCGDALTELRQLPSESVQCCVTSPPYWGLRDYACQRQLGLEATPSEYTTALVAIFREVHRVLRPDGTVFLNLGDSHKDKQLQGIPWRVAFALQADGWYLRSDIIWSKPNPMPESVSDRPTKAHEYVFLLSKSKQYYYDAEAIAEPLQTAAHNPGNRITEGHKGTLHHGQWSEHNMDKVWGESGRRNKRSVWLIPTNPYPEAHFATFPPDLIKPMIMAGSRIGDVILDPFAGSGTTGQVALELGRKAVLIELNPNYTQLIQQRCNTTVGLPF